MLLAELIHNGVVVVVVALLFLMAQGRFSIVVIGLGDLS